MDQVSFACGCDAVILGLAIVLGDAPKGCDKPLVLQPMESGVKRTVLDLKYVL